MKVLVPLDGSRLSEAILPRVAAFAARLGAEVELLVVALAGRVRPTPLTYAVRETIPAGTATGSHLNVPLLGEIVPPPAETREQAVERVESELADYLQARIDAIPGAVVTTRVLFADDPGEAIIAHAREEQVDVIAMATHGRAGISHLLAGSVTERVIRSGVAPVLTIRPAAEAAKRTG